MVALWRCFTVLAAKCIKSSCPFIYQTRGSLNNTTETLLSDYLLNQYPYWKGTTQRQSQPINFGFNWISGFWGEDRKILLKTEILKYQFIFISMDRLSVYEISFRCSEHRSACIPGAVGKKGGFLAISIIRRS